MGKNIQTENGLNNFLQPDQLLGTKLYIPKIIPSSISRDRLYHHLSRGLERKLTLICAPAGYGKSTLLSQWLAVHLSDQFRKAWVSLNECDNDPGHFWRYMIAAFEMVYPGIGKNALALLNLPESPPITSILTILINELDKTTYNFVIGLDDYHFISNKSIHQDLIFFINHLPSNVHMVISSRVKPPLGLSRLRVRGQLNEIYINDLRFTGKEMEEFFRKNVDSKIPANIVSALEAKMEGWAVGMQLASLSLKAVDNYERFVRSFTGNDSLVMDYLSEEVLQNQPADIQLFLMKTSILKGFNISLCNAVTESEHTEDIFEYLKKQNLFIISLDDRHRWYRYHHLFSEFLLERLERVMPNELAGLHYRASKWYEKCGLINDAIDHALVAKNYNQAAKLIEKYAQAMLNNGEAGTLSNWLEKLPEEVIRSSIRLSLDHAWVIGRVMDFFTRAQEVQCRLDIALQRLKDIGDSLGFSLQKLFDAEKGSMHSQDVFVSLATMQDTSLPDVKSVLGETFAIYAIISARQDNLSNTIRFSNFALEFLQPNTFLCALVNLWLAKAYRKNNDMQAAKTASLNAVGISERIDNIYYLIGSMYCLADTEFMQGNLDEAAKIYRKLLQIANERGGRIISSIALASLELGWLMYEWNQLGDAMHYMLEAIQIGKEAKDSNTVANGYHGLAQVFLAKGDVKQALEMNRKAEYIARTYKLKPVDRRVEKQYIEICILDNEDDKIDNWSKKYTFNVEELGDNIQFKELVQYCLFARVLIYQRNLLKAIRFLDQLLDLVNKVKRPEHAKWILKLKALACYKRGDTRDALASLSEALAIAEPGKHVQIFLSEGLLMFEMLSKLLKIRRRKGSLNSELSGFSQAYLEELVSHFERKFKRAELEKVAQKPVVEPLAAKQIILQSISKREVEVLRYLEDGVSNKEIAQKLFITPGTVKRHLENIYGKLAVTNRAQAITRARELMLL